MRPGRAFADEDVTVLPIVMWLDPRELLDEVHEHLGTCQPCGTTAAPTGTTTTLRS